MYELARELRDDSVLLATTTRIYPPGREQVDATYNGIRAPQLLDQKIKDGRYMLFGGYDAKGKLTPPDMDILEKLTERFDYTIMECDGSKGLPLKGYKDSEPCVPPFANTLVAVATLWAIGEPVNDRFVHRVDEYCEMTGAKPGEPISLEQIAKLISHPKGPFKEPCERRILFLNHMEIDKEYGRALDLLHHMPKDFVKSLSAVVAGSLYSQRFQQILPKYHSDLDDDYDD